MTNDDVKYSIRFNRLFTEKSTRYINFGGVFSDLPGELWKRLKVIFELGLSDAPSVHVLL